LRTPGGPKVSRGTSVPDQPGASPWGIFAGIAVAALAIAALPGVASEGFTPKYALQPVGFVSLGVLVIAALVLGITMIVGDAAYAHAPPHGYDLGDARRADSAFPYWPESAYALEDMDLYLRAQSQSPLTGPTYLVGARRVALQLASRAPFEPQGWTAAAATCVITDQHAQADHYYLRALEYDRWDIPLQGLGLVAANAHEWAIAAHWLSEEDSVIPPGPEKSQVVGWLKDVERHVVPTA
jgi:hypothetical protein